MERTDVYGFEMLQPEEIARVVKKERAMLVDLRGEESYREGHIRNAGNYPIAYIDEWSRDLPDPRSLILYCEHGNQSLLAARKLRKRPGKVYTVVGGYQAYQKHEKQGGMQE